MTVSRFAFTTRLYTLVGLCLLVGVLATSAVLYRMDGLTDAYSELLAGPVQNRETARRMQVEFKRQVQEWKNILIRGHEPDSYQKHLEQFFARQRAVRQLGAELRAGTTDPEQRALLERFAAAHAELGARYAGALRAYAQTRDYRQADEAVRGMDRAPTALIDSLAARIDRDVAVQAEAHAARVAAERNLILALVLLLALAGALVGWRTVRGLLRPMRAVLRRTQSLRDVCIANLQRATDALAHGDLDVELQTGTRPMQVRSDDELGQIAAQINGIIEQTEAAVRSFEHARGTLRDVVGETGRLIEAAREGRLHQRGDADRYEGSYRELVLGTNQMLDAVVQPVHATSEVLGRMADGDFSARIEGEFRGDFAQMTGSVNRTLDGLRELLARIRSTSGTVASSSEQIRISSQSMAGAAEETTRQVQTVSAASEQAGVNVQTVAVAAEEMGGSIREISRALQDALAVARQATEQSQRTVHRMGELGASSEEIGDVVQVITRIAEQTHLLALNATIEAARAGDAGRGFAVVAHEVKQLARETAQATEQISGRVRALQDSTRSATADIEQISGVITRLNDISAAIAAAMEQQSASTSEIARNVTQASRGTEEVTRSIGSVSAAASESASGATQNLQASEQLAAVASELEGLVGRFRV